MSVEVRMPAYSETMEEADVVGWLVAPGDRVEQGDPIAEIETDKATGELEAPSAGVISKILVEEGSQGVKVGELLALIEPADESADQRTNETTSEPPSGPRDQPAANTALDTAVELAASPTASAEHAAVSQPDIATSAAPGPVPEADRVPATALARRLADRAGLDLSTISGSGASGRVLKADVESLADGEVLRTANSADRGQPTSAPPQLLLRVECRADPARTACQRLSALEPDTPIPLLALIVRAAASALREVSEANSAWIDGELVPQDGSTVALGLASARGGQAVCVRDADRKSLAVLAAEIAAGASGAASAPSETGAGPAALSIVDVGDADVDSIQLSVVPPSVCVLGTGALAERPVAVDGKLAVAAVMTCTLAADARALDPETAARLLSGFKRRLEDPSEMILS